MPPLPFRRCQAKNKHYQLACGDTFTARYATELAEGVQHPNQFFKASRKALGAYSRGLGGTQLRPTSRTSTGSFGRSAAADVFDVRAAGHDTQQADEGAVTTSGVAPMAGTDAAAVVAAN